jgi:transcriptional antiterminator NusG
LNPEGIPKLMNLPNEPHNATHSSEAAAPDAGSSLPAGADLHAAVAGEHAEHAHPAAADQAVMQEEEDDGTPAELADPFSGSEDAKPISMSGEAAEQIAAGDRQWYILKVQSNREDSIRETLMRRIQMQGLDKYFGDVVVPKEQVTEFKGGKKRVVWKKLYPGYILVNMLLNDDTWYLVRETGGIGDFTGSAGRPSPMLPQDVAKLLNKAEVKADEAPRLKIAFKKGDRVKINEGTFENFEGEVEQIDEANGRVTVMLSIFGRSTPVDIEYWQIESV